MSSTYFENFEEINMELREIAVMADFMEKSRVHLELGEKMNIGSGEDCINVLFADNYRSVRQHEKD